MFNKILIANRGEIACRIVRTCKRMGVGTVAVYSDADADALHVMTADQAVRIGEASVSDSYLRAAVIVEAALKTGAEAIHPGYGFLSENPEFVAQVEAAGLCFIGPSVSAIRAMGLKDAAKSLMHDAGVPVVPGYHGNNQDPDFLAQQADSIGYPVLIKARAGGGGKGMRKVESRKDFHQSLAGASREALASFGDGACLIEKFIDTPRHIEIQVFGDDHGNVVHLFERDCSLQRRHQKVIEEAPAPGMTVEMRNAMGEAAVRACQAINYSGAGTVEFIVDASAGLRPDRFWFMEMNTRLQVEHPVTEAITGQDLVEWQLRVATGEPLPRSQAELGIDGWAIEARVYAEDVESGFLPAIGKLDTLEFPPATRIDTGVRQGDTITPYYDPMIAKLVVHAESREQALQQLRLALNNTFTAGATTNLRFLSALCNNASFACGEVDTGLIERNIDTLIAVENCAPSSVAIAALAALGIDYTTEKQHGFALWQPMRRIVKLTGESAVPCYEISVFACGNNEYKVEYDEHCLVVKCLAEKYVINNNEVVTATAIRDRQQIHVFCNGRFSFSYPDLLVAAEEQAHGSNIVIAPMPGQIKVVAVKNGDSVLKGDTLLVLEAMKMEHTLNAPRDGIIEEVLVILEEQVESGSVLVSMLPES